MPSESLPLALDETQGGVPRVALGSRAVLLRGRARVRPNSSPPSAPLPRSRRPAIWCADRPRRIPLIHGDVVVWSGPDRRTYHGVHFLAESEHPLTGTYRFNLTFRRAL